MYANTSVAAKLCASACPFPNRRKDQDVTHKYPSDLTFSPFPPDLTSGSAKKRQPSIDPAQLIAEGIASDWRLAIPENWSINWFTRARPVGPPEFEALFSRIVPLPGVPRPKQYGVMCCDLDAVAGTLGRWLYEVDKRSWRDLTEKYYSGRPAMFVPDWRHGGLRPPRAIYSDTLYRNAPVAGAF